MNKLFACLILLLTATYGKAQGVSAERISVRILSEEKKGLEGVTAALLNATDSVLIKSSITDANGIAEWRYVKPSMYRIKLSHINYATTYTDAFQVGSGANIALEDIILTKKQAGELAEVSITARKPFIQKLTDRIIVNVDASIISAGSSAIEVLERSPGVTIDQNDVISLRGRSGVIIMIDGKPSPMGGADLANYLRSLPSNAIDRIEIITNPSAKYDAAGNSGIIDIRLKKDQRMGTNGSVNLGYGQGVYPKANGGVTFNYRNKKMNAFGNYNHIYRKNLNHLFLNRNFYTNNVFTGGDDKDNYTTIPVNADRARFGMDFFPGSKTIIGFVVNGGLNAYQSHNRNSSVVVDYQKNAIHTFNTTADNNNHGKDFVGNINFKHSFDSTGRELTADLDYGIFSTSALSQNATSYYKLDGTNYLPSYKLNGDQDSKLTLRTAKVDYVQHIGKARFEAGIKTSFVSADNDAVFTDLSSGTPVNDAGKTNHFLYDENNNSGYVNLRREYKKWDWQAGLRAEQTNVSTFQQIGKVQWDSSYLQLFPSLFLNYKLTPDQTIGLSVSRRIDRPGYSELNPFLFLIDVTTYSTGNPGLLPQFTWSYEANYTMKRLNFSLVYSKTEQPENTILTRFKDQFPNLPSDENVTVQIPVNLESSEYVGITIAAPLKITPWWNMTNNANFYYSKFRGKIAGSLLDDGKPVADLRTNNSFNFKDGWGAELSVNYNSGERSGYMVFKSRWGMALGVQKSVLKGAGTIRLNANDIFWTNLPRATVNIPGRYIENWHAIRESRTINLNFTYSFGNKKVQAARKRTTGSEEEIRRI